MNIGRIHVDSRLVLAPMAGVTDLAFRQIQFCAGKSRGMFYRNGISPHFFVKNLDLWYSDWKG